MATRLDRKSKAKAKVMTNAYAVAKVEHSRFNALNDAVTFEVFTSLNGGVTFRGHGLESGTGFDVLDRQNKLARQGFHVEVVER